MHQSIFKKPRPLGLKNKLNNSINFLMILSCGLGPNAFAGLVPSSFNYQGTMYDSTGVNPLLTVVDFKLGIYAPNGCLLYEETQTGIDLSQSNGEFSLKIGQGSRTANDLGLSLTNVFANAGTQLSSSSTNCPSGYTPSSTDSRSLQVAVTVEATSATVTLSPNLSINSVPNAMVAESLQGLTPASFIQSSGTVSQSNITSLTNGSDASPLHNHDSRYVQLGSTPTFSELTVSNTPSNPTDAVNLSYLNSVISGLSSVYSPIGAMSYPNASSSQTGVLSSSDWNTFNNKLSSSLVSGDIWVGNSSGVATPVIVSGDATIGNSGIVTLTSTGVTAGTYSKVVVNVKGLVTSGSAITAADLPAPAGDVTGSYAATKVTGIQGVPVSSTAPVTGSLLVYNGTNYVPTTLMAAGISGGATGGVIGQVINWPTSSCPVGFLPTDGSSLLISSYSTLYSAIGTTYGSADASHFYVPDYRGYFLRGTDNMGVGAAGRDPNAGSRTAMNGMPGADTGNLVGSVQGDQMQGHNHASGVAATGGGGNLFYFAGGNYNGANGSGVDTQSDITVTSPITDGTNGTPRVGSETRPSNAYINYCIQYTSVASAGSVTGPTSEFHARAQISNTCTVISQGGTWITATNHTSTGNCTLTIVGFAGVPSCSFVTDETVPPTNFSIKTTSTSTSLVIGELTSASSTYQDAPFRVECTY
jgi:microcystin-dependent protein